MMNMDVSTDCSQMASVGAQENLVVSNPEEENLIDLNTPQGETITDRAFATEERQKKEILIQTLVETHSIPNGEHMNPASDIPRSISSNSNSENNVGSNSLYVSHTESGYLTDSVTSVMSRERHHSDASELDKTPNKETQPCSSSETDTTPCGEALISFSNEDLNSIEHTGVKTGIKAKAEAKLIDFDDSDKDDQLQALANLDLNAKQDPKSLDEIFASNCAPTRPDFLYFRDKRARSISDYEVHGSRYGPPCDMSHVEKTDLRKRSKSSAFPIPRIKEGVNISEESLSKSLPHGQIMRKDTGLIEFIADDLQEKIRRSSPMSKTASSDVSSRRSSLLSLNSIDSFSSSTMATSMTSGMSRSYPQSPDCIPPIDPMAVFEIEHQARLLADSLDHMMGNLRNNLHKMSAISVGCEEAYRTSVDVTCESVDSSIKSMYALMAKCEELSGTMQPVYKLAEQIKEIKRLLDRFEAQLTDKP